MSNFNLNELLNIDDSSDEYKIKYIDINDISLSENNFYDTTNIDDLKDSIELLGLQQNLVVNQSIDGNYELIAGHRRFLALKELYKTNEEKYRLIPCKVNENTKEFIELQLIMTNSTTRKLSSYEQMTQTVRLKEILTNLKNDGTIKGNVRKHISKMLGISESKIARNEVVNNNLIEPLKEDFKNNNINMSVAYEMAKLPEDEQIETLKEIKKIDEIVESAVTVNDVKCIVNNDNVSEIGIKKNTYDCFNPTEEQSSKAMVDLYEIYKKGYIGYELYDYTHMALLKFK